MSTKDGPWIKRITGLNEIERAQLDDGWPLLRINDKVAFDLTAWRDIKPWKMNPIQPREGSKLRSLRADMMSRGMDEPPVIDLSDGWVGDGNSRLIAYDDIRRDGHFIDFPGFRTQRWNSHTQRHDYQVARAIVHRQLTTRERKHLVRAGIGQHVDWSDNRLGSLYGLSQETVTRISDEMVARGEIPPRPTMRIDASGREIDVGKLKRKPRKTTPTHSLLPLATAWHAKRGGHPTDSSQILQIATRIEFDFASIGLSRSQAQEHLNLCNWLTRQVGKLIGPFIVASYRAESGLVVFSLVRSNDFRPTLNDDTENSVHTYTPTEAQEELA